MTMSLEPADIPDGTEDDAPDVDSPGYDPEAPYGRTASGRIRKRPVGTARTSGGGPARNERLARQATAVIVQINSYMVLAAMAASFTDTASKLAEREEKFSNDVYNALVLDPALCATILKAGVKSGKLMLIAAVGGHTASVFPTLWLEYKYNRMSEEAA